MPPYCQIHGMYHIRFSSTSAKTDMQCPVCRILGNRYPQQSASAREMRGDIAYDEVAKGNRADARDWSRK